MIKLNLIPTWEEASKLKNVCKIKTGIVTCLPKHNAMANGKCHTSLSPTATTTAKDIRPMSQYSKALSTWNSLLYSYLLAKVLQ